MLDESSTSSMVFNCWWLNALKRSSWRRFPEKLIPMRWPEGRAVAYLDVGTVTLIEMLRCSFVIPPQSLVQQNCGWFGDVSTLIPTSTTTDDCLMQTTLCVLIHTFPLCRSEFAFDNFVYQPAGCYD